MRASLGCLLCSLLLYNGTVLYAAEDASPKHPSLAVALRPVAKAIAGRVASNGLRQVGVVEFTAPADAPEGSAGGAGVYIASLVEKQLTLASRRPRAVANTLDLREYLRQAGVGPRDLREEKPLPDLSGRLGDADALVLGTITRDPAAPGTLTIAARLVRLAGGETLVKETCVAAADSDLRCLLGERVTYKPSKGIEVVADDDGTSYSVTKGRIEVLDHKTGAPLPLFSADEDRYVAARLGQRYIIRLHNDGTDQIGVALLVDGLNTIYGRPAAASDGPLWILEPGETRDVEGWCLRTEDGKTEVREFLFGTADSEADRQRFAASPGLITATFFRKNGNAKGSDVVTTTGKVVDGVVVKEMPFPVGVGSSVPLRYAGGDVVRRLKPIGTAVLGTAP